MEATHSRLPEVEAFLAGGPLKAVVGGKDMESSTGQVLETHDPGSGERLAQFYAMQAEDVDRAVQAGDQTFREGGWARLAPAERAVLLHRLADAVEKRQAAFAQLEALDGGKLAAVATGVDVPLFISAVRYFADLSVHVQRRTPIAVAGHEAWTALHPWGVCGFILPWNFPLALVGWACAPALAAGNTVVIKPAEDTPLTTIHLAQVAREAGIPDGVINVVPGLGETAGAALARHPGLSRMSFTGSPEVGRMVGAACGANLVPALLELGGKGAAVVFEDVDVADTAQKLVQAVTFHSGQVCCTATRWLVHRPVYDELVAECVRLLRGLQIGYQCDGATQMGPLVNEKQRERVLSYIRAGQEEGAEALLPGGPASVPGYEKGHYVCPAVLAGPLDNVAAREEIFGPVSYVAPFDDEAEAVAMANRTAYGLANSVWTRDLDRARRVAEAMVAGSSWINGHNIFGMGMPFGGVKQSGMGGHVNSPETLSYYWRSQTVARPLA